MAVFSLYLHIPFCTHRCAYCDFNTYARMEAMIPAYIRALCSEIEQVVESAGKRMDAHTVFFGGGTPSLLEAGQVGEVLGTLRRCFNLSAGAEITMEANPGTVDLEWLEAVREQGVNRLSFGMQSADATELRLLTRQHAFADVVQAVKWARLAGFDNLSLDLMFGLPGQQPETWQKTLDAAVELQPEHLSLYSLTVEDGTPLKRWVERGLVVRPDDDAAAEMYERAMEQLGFGDYQQYEISNWARPGRECRHNLQYWLNKPYLGFGAGAHGYARAVRTENLNGIAEYIAAVQAEKRGSFPRGPALLAATEIDRETEMGETMMVGLRLTDRGVDAMDFEARFGESLTNRFGVEIRRLQAQGLVEWTSGDRALRLTRRGRLFGNRVFREFI